MPKLSKHYKGSPFCFKLITKSEKHFVFICETQKEYQDWLDGIKALQLEAQQKNLQLQARLLQQ